MLDNLFTTYTTPLFITSIITLILLVIGARRQHVAAARIFVLFCTAVVVWSFCYALEFLADGVEAKLFWARVQYLGLISPVAFLLFTQLYLGVEEYIPWQNVIILMIMPLIANVAAWTNDQHHLLWTHWKLDETGVYPGLQLSHGLIFFAIVGYSYFLLAGGVYYIWAAFRSNSYTRRWQAGILLAAVAAPWLGNLLYVLRLSPNGLDLTPINFGITSIFLAIGLFRYHFLDVTPIARYRVMEKLEDSLIIVDDRGRIVDINPAAAKLLHVTSRSAVARPAQELLHELPNLVSKLDTETSVDLTTYLTVNEEKRIYNASISVLKDRQQRIQGRVVMLHDVTQQERDAEALRQSESQLREMVHQLQELDQLKRRFMRNINHELRTPLTNITLYIDLMRNGNPENFSRYLQVLEKESSTLRRLIEQTLDLDRLDQTNASQPIYPKRINLNQLLEGIAQWAARIAEKSDLSFQYTLSDKPILVKADSELLQIAISNILSNACNFTPARGRICLTLRSNDDSALIEIKDSGVGISERDREHIFERFYRGEHTNSGTVPGLGLGLSIAKANIERNGGRIEVESVLNSGSTFTIYLPLIKEMG